MDIRLFPRVDIFGELQKCNEMVSFKINGPAVRLQYTRNALLTTHMQKICTV